MGCMGVVIAFKVIVFSFNEIFFVFCVFIEIIYHKATLYWVILFAKTFYLWRIQVSKMDKSIHIHNSFLGYFNERRFVIQ